MQFFQNDLQTLISQCPGDRKQFFAESSHALSISVVNGRVEPVSQAHSQGVSLISTSGGNKYFESKESFVDWQSVFSSVTKLVELSNKDSTHFATQEATWKSQGKVFEFSEPNLLPEVQLLLTTAMPFLEKLRAKDWIQSTSLGLGMRKTQYLAVSSTSEGGMDEQFQYRLFVLATGTKNGIVQEYYDAITANGDISKLDTKAIQGCFDEVESKLAALLDAEVAPSGEMDIVITAEAGGVIIHEAVGHGLEGDLQGSSVYAGKIGQKVASEKVTIIDDPTLPGLRGSYMLDHEGVIAERAVLIEKGILKNYLHQQDTSDFLELPGNGHSRRESYSCEPIVRMSNTYMDNGTDTLDAMIASVKDGILVTSLGGGQVNTASGDFVFKVNFGYRIQDGKIGGVIRGANLSGNGPEMLQSIKMVGNDLVVGEHAYFIGGTCGKDGQGMSVTDANPSMLVRLKVTG